MMTGADAEERACQFLRTEGCRVVGRNWRTRTGEIDIIVRDGDVLVFVEVKARSDDRYGGPEGAVDRTKQERIIRAACRFVQSTACELPMRFDVVAVRPESVRWHKDAFRLPETCSPDC